MINLIRKRLVIFFIILPLFTLGALYYEYIYVFYQMVKYAYIDDNRAKPEKIEINLSKSGVVADFKFQVKTELPYNFGMSFRYPENNELERARIRKLLGGAQVDKNGQPVERGVLSPVNLKIFSVYPENKEFEIYNQEIDPMLTSWGSGRFGVEIGWHRLTPGTYRALLVNKRSVPEMSSVYTTFGIYRPRI